MQNRKRYRILDSILNQR